MIQTGDSAASAHQAPVTLSLNEPVDPYGNGGGSVFNAQAPTTGQSARPHVQVLATVNSSRTIMLVIGLSFGACALALFGALQFGAFGDADGVGFGSQRRRRRDRKGAVRVAASDPDEEDGDIIGDEDYEEEVAPKRRGRRGRRAKQHRDEEEAGDDDEFDAASALHPAEEEEGDGEEDGDSEEEADAPRVPAMAAEPDEFDIALEERDANGGSSKASKKKEKKEKKRNREKQQGKVRL